MYSIQNNSPSAGYIQWANVNIQYNGVSYPVADGYTNYTYVYWLASNPTTFVVSDTFPTLTPADVLVFLNKSGVAMVVPTATIIDGGLIVPGSIYANAIAANTITGNKIAADAITADHIAANAITAGAIAADAVGAGAIASGVIVADHIASGAITADKLAANTITAASGVIANAAILNAMIANVDAGKITTGYLGAARIEAGTITFDKLATAAVADINSEIEIGGRNLLKNTGTPVTNANYLMASYDMGDEWPVAGETYTLSVKFTLGADRTHLSLYTIDGTVLLTTVADADKNSLGVASKIFTMSYAVGKTPADGYTALAVYQMLSGGSTASTIEWLKLEKGNKATDWTPAPEDKADSETNATIDTKNVTLKINTTDGFAFYDGATYRGGMKVRNGKLTLLTDILGTVSDENHFVEFDEHNLYGSAAEQYSLLKFFASDNAASPAPVETFRMASRYWETTDTAQTFLGIGINETTVDAADVILSAGMSLETPIGSASLRLNSSPLSDSATINLLAINPSENSSGFQIYANASAPKIDVMVDYTNIGQWLSTGLKINGNFVWHGGNDGSGSGLDADKLDGREGWQYPRGGTDSYSYSTLNTSVNTLPSGFYRCSDGPAGWMHLINLNHQNADGYGAQIRIDYFNGDMYYRSSDALVFDSWHKVWDDGNFTPGDYLARSGGTMTGALFFSELYAPSTAGVYFDGYGNIWPRSGVDSGSFWNIRDSLGNVKFKFWLGKSDPVEMSGLTLTGQLNMGSNNIVGSTSDCWITARRIGLGVAANSTYTVDAGTSGYIRAGKYYAGSGAGGLTTQIRAQDLSGNNRIFDFTGGILTGVS